MRIALGRTKQCDWTTNENPSRPVFDPSKICGLLQYQLSTRDFHAMNSKPYFGAGSYALIPTNPFFGIQNHYKPFTGYFRCNFKGGTLRFPLRLLAKSKSYGNPALGVGSLLPEFREGTV